MTAPPKDPLAEARALREKAREAFDLADAESVRLCNGTRRWTMRIPASTSDSDFVFHDAVVQGRALLDALEASVARCEALDEDINALYMQRDGVNHSTDCPENAVTRGMGELCLRCQRDALRAQVEALMRERDRYHDALIARHGGEPVALLDELDEARQRAEAAEGRLAAIEALIVVDESMLPPAQQREEPSSEACRWKLTTDKLWESTCGEAWTFFAYGPPENGFKFCPYCRKRIKVVGAKGGE